MGMVLVAEGAKSHGGISPLVALAQCPYCKGASFQIHAKARTEDDIYLLSGIDILTVTTPRTSHSGGILFCFAFVLVYVTTMPRMCRDGAGCMRKVEYELRNTLGSRV